MICRNCGTEIADKAIVCYRCGTGTSEPVRQPAVIRRRRGPLFSIVAIVLLALLGLYLGGAGRTVMPTGPWIDAARVAIVAVIVLLIVRIARRR